MARRSRTLAGLLLGWGCLAVHAQTVVRVTVGPSYGPGIADGPSDTPSVSADGRYIAFVSQATNLTPGTVNGVQQVYVRDRVNGTMVRASVAPDGTPGDDSSTAPAISADGRYVAFQSVASNLAPNTGGGRRNVFLRDLRAGTTICLSLAPDGSPADGNSFAPSISADGRYVAFESTADNLVAGDANGQEDVFVRDVVADVTTRVSVAADGSESNTYAYSASMSGDGRTVAFAAGDGNLVAGDTNGHDDIFVRDRVAGTTVRASLATGGAQSDGESWNPALSADGRHVAFESQADNLVPGDTNTTDDVFLRDLNAGTTVRVSVGNGGTEVALGGAHPAVSGDGRFVAFQSGAPDLVPGDTNGVSDVFLRDTVVNTTARVSVAADGSQASGRSLDAAISDDGHVVAFASDAANLMPGDTNGARDVFARDTAASTTSLASVAAEQRVVPADRDTAWASLSADGRYAAFYSAADNLVPGDTNGVSDVFVRDTWANITERVSVASDGSQANGGSYAFLGPPSISADGRYVAFISRASNLVAGDTNGAPDVFVRDRVAGATTRVDVAWDGSQASGDNNASVYQTCSLSADGRYVAFVSDSSNLVPNDTNSQDDLFLRDTANNTTERVNLTPSGDQSPSGGVGAAIPSVSADGRYVAFDSLYDLVTPQTGTVSYLRSFVRDRMAHTTIRIPGNSPDGNEAHMETGGIRITADGQYVVYGTHLGADAPQAPALWGIYLRNLQTNVTTWASRPPDGTPPNEGSWDPSVSADGRFVAFWSKATNLVPGDTNGVADVFVWDRTTGGITRVSRTSSGGQANQDSSDAAISADGRYATFVTAASNIVPGDTNNANDVFEVGPLFTSPPFSLSDAADALRYACGLAVADAAVFDRLNVVAVEAGPNAIDLHDAVRLARKAAGLDTSP